jgi:3-dehydroquinate dehydratase type I
LTPRICVSILPKTLSEAVLLVKKSEESFADFVEVRLDNLKMDVDLAGLASQGSKPKIATERSGRNESERRTILLNAAGSGFKFVDIDLSTPKISSFVKQVKDAGTKCIISFHDNDRTACSEDLHNILDKELLSGADICKIVTTAKNLDDNLVLLQFVKQASAKTKLVCFGMGEEGKISRLLSPLFGCFFTFASLEIGAETAPGQMSIVDMKNVYNSLRLK